MEYWEVPMNPMTRKRLTEDELDLGSIEHDPQRGEYLMFRDRFVAMKIAARLGARACPVAPRNGRPEA